MHDADVSLPSPIKNHPIRCISLYLFFFKLMSNFYEDIDLYLLHHHYFLFQMFPVSGKMYLTLLRNICPNRR